MKQHKIKITDALLIRYLLGECGIEEIREVEAWVAANDENRAKMEGFRQILEAGKSITPPTPADPEAAWEKFKTLRMERSQEAQGRGKVINFWERSRPFMLAAAAITVILFLSVLMKPWQIPGGSTQNSLAILKYASGEKTRKDTLSDGTIVTLNKNSVLHAPKSFSDTDRVVQLTGEAFFEVTPNALKPFKVQTPTINILVVGTSFNVNTRPDAPSVIVETGKVNVQYGRHAVQVLPGEKAGIKPGADTLEVMVVRDKLYQAFRTRQIWCDNTPLSELVELLQNHFDRPIEIANPAIRSLSISTTFELDSIDNILNIISQTLDIKVETSGEKIILR